MVNITKGRSKIEKMGLAEECLRLKGKGFGSVRISKALSDISGEDINNVNVDNFFKSFRNDVAKNAKLTANVDTALKEMKLENLGNWKKIDGHLENLLNEASAIQKKFVGVDKKSGEPIIIDVKDLRLWKDVLNDIAKITEIRARLLGQIQSGGKQIFITHIENQYNDLKQLVLSAEEKFPGLNDWLSEQLLKGVGGR